MNVKRLRCVVGVSICVLVFSLTRPAGAGIVPGDFDNDCDVDSADFEHLRACARGSGLAQTNPVCADARLDTDGNVDLDDFGIFQRCYSGENVPANPNCNHTCVGPNCNCVCGQTDCGGTCVNTKTDNANCGTCGHACVAGTTCQNGSCAPCPGAACGCTDLNWDALNCVACGHTCQPLEYCSYGECYGTCGPGGCE